MAGGNEYLLQKVNSDVFAMPLRVMHSMVATIDAQNRSLAASGERSVWEPITLVPTRDGHPFLDLDRRPWMVDMANDGQDSEVAQL